MAKGQQLKKEIQSKILETFSGSFLYNDGKEIRICGYENGESLQVKCVLTCAKENVESGADNALPGDFPAPTTTTPTPVRTEPIAPTDQEKENVTQMLRRLGL